MEQWVADTGARVVVIFEGRDAAGKGGAIKRITEHTNPRITKHVALPKPTERQTLAVVLPAIRGASCPRRARSSCSTAVGTTAPASSTCSGSARPAEYYRFLRQCPIFERLLVEDGIILIKYWFSVSDEEQERRFAKRIDDPLRRWKLSETDLYSRTKWVDYSRAKDEMFVHTDIPEAPWYVVEPTTRRRRGSTASRTCCRRSRTRSEARARDRAAATASSDEGYVRPPRELYTYVPDHAGRDRRRARRRSTTSQRAARLDALTRSGRYTRSSRASATDLRIPVTNGISTFV